MAAALLLAGAAAWPLWQEPGLLNTRGGGDSPFLLQRLHQLSTALADGHFPVRWMPDANYGYGYPFFNYYAPLSIYIAALFRGLGASYVGAVQLAQLSGFLVAAAAMFRLGQRWFRNDWAALLAAGAYTLAPFHMVNVYVRGDSLAEFWAMAFYPIVILTADSLVRAGGRQTGKIIRLALAYAALILSHNISALIFTPFLLLFLFWRQWLPALRTRQNWSDFIAAVSGPILALALALLLSAWFWLPALAEQSLAQLEPVTAGYFHYSNHFRGADLVQSSLLFDYDVADGRSFRMGLIQTLTLLAGAPALLLPRRKRGEEVVSEQAGRPPRLFILGALLLATVMMTPLARLLWDHLPLLPFTQFPWRFLSVQAFAGAMATAGLVWWLPRRQNFVALLTLAALLLAGLGGLDTDHLALSDADITAEKLAQYEWFSGNIGSTVSAEYLPTGVQPRPYTSPWLTTGSRDQLQSLEAPLSQAELLNRQTARQEWRLAARSATTVVLPTLHWPGWQATLDEEPVSIWPADGSGLITLALPPGQHTLVLSLGRTPVRVLAELLSLASLVGLVVLGSWQYVRRSSRRPTEIHRDPQSFFKDLCGSLWISVKLYVPSFLKKPAITTTVLALAAAALLLRFWPAPEYAPGSESWDFEQLGYLHHAPDGIEFDGDLTLQEYRYNGETFAPGDLVRIELGWNRPPAAEMALDLVSPAVNRFPAAPALAGAQQAIPDNPGAFELTIPANAPPGLYLPRLQLAGLQALTPSGQPRGALYLRPIQVLNPGTAADEAAGAIQIQAHSISQRDDQTLDVQLQWFVARPQTANYNVSLRLLDADGLALAALDRQPGYGFLPSSGWPAGRWVDDWLALPLPDEIEEGRPLALVVRLYDLVDETAVLTRRLGELTSEKGQLVFLANEPSFTLPNDISPASVTYEEQIALRGYRLDQRESQLDLILYWQALAPGREDFFHFVHLVDPQTGEIVAQHDGMPRQNSYPTGQWSSGEIVADALLLDLTTVSPGRYLLYAGLYRQIGVEFPRLTAVDAQDTPLSDNRFLIGEIIIP